MNSKTKQPFHIFDSSKSPHINTVTDRTLRGLLDLGEGSRKSFRDLVSDRDFLSLIREELGFLSGTYGVINEMRAGEVTYVDSKNPNAVTIPRYLAEWKTPQQWILLPVERRPELARNLEDLEREIRTELTTSIKACRGLRTPGTYPLTLWERGNDVFLAEEGELWFLYLEKELREIRDREGDENAKDFCRSRELFKFVDRKLWRTARGADKKLLRKHALLTINNWIDAAVKHSSDAFSEWRGRPGSWFLERSLAWNLPIASWSSLAELIYNGSDDQMKLSDWLKGARVHVGIAQVFMPSALLVFTFGPLMEEEEEEERTLSQKARPARLRGFFTGAFCNSDRLKTNIREIKIIFSLLGQHNLMHHVTDIALHSEQQRLIGTATNMLSHKLQNPVFIAAGRAAQIDKIARKAAGRGGSIAIGGVKKIISNCEIIETNLDSLRQFITRFIAYAEVGRRKDQQLDLRMLLEEAKNESEELLRDAEVSVELSTPPGLACYGDFTTLKEIFVNLIENAAKALRGQRERLISIKAEPGDIFTTIRVSDTGPGIRLELLHAIFEPGQHFPHADDKSKSTGMGLAMCRRIAEAHGGQIEARPSRPGEGAEFVIRLPSTKT